MITSFFFFAHHLFAGSSNESPIIVSPSELRGPGALFRFVSYAAARAPFVPTTRLCAERSVAAGSCLEIFLLRFGNFNFHAR